MRTLSILIFFLFVLIFPQFSKAGPTLEIREVSIFEINSAITPASLDYLKHHFAKLPPKALVLIKLNTPGGLVQTTKDMITLFGEQPHPLVVWITPHGASAASAGAILSSAAHFIFMNPGTNMGAATPVGLGEDIKEGDGRKKALNDLTALVRSLNDSHRRPSAPFELMITEAKSYTDQEAFKEKIINGVFSFESEILEHLEGETFLFKGEEVSLHFVTPNLKKYEPSLGQKILEVLANPSLAYFLFLIGAALIYFELQAPGGFIAGSIGVGLLLLAAVSFQVLPLNWGAFGLIILGIVLLVLEIFITSYGLLGLFGVTSTVVGSLFLFHTETGFMSVEYPVMISTLLGVLFSGGLIVWYILKDKKKQKTSSHFFSPLHETGTIINKSEEFYQVKVQGEIWRAESEEPLKPGDKVEVTEVNEAHLKLKIKKIHT
jgi:membrane-bound serine protease (ClpP class)